ncbi:MAG: acyl-CoA reductase [Saprospiraceae bacterium]
MNLDDRIRICVQVGKYLLDKPNDLIEVIRKVGQENVWFNSNSTWSAIENIATIFLKEENLRAWTANYSILERTSKKVGLVMAGNIPLVGFHDVLAVYICGYHSVLKLSQKDSLLWPYILGLFRSIDQRTESYFTIEDRLQGIDAVIATGSDNASRYFLYYFGKYPHVIRKNRVGIAVLTGQETEKELMSLGSDVFQFYGLGCRNVSSLLVPEGYGFIPLLKLWESYGYLRDNHAYNNNYDYNYAIYLMNQTVFLANGAVILMECMDLVSRLACLNYRYYKTIEDAITVLSASKEKIQTIVCHQNLAGVRVLYPGQTQCPGLMDYADEIDIVQFLLTL